MTTEEKALAMVREGDALGLLNFDAAIAALCRAIEQHEAFRQEVSDIVHDYVHGAGKKGTIDEWENLKNLIIPAPKPDPLVEALDSLGLRKADEWAGDIRKALAARGLEIREKNDG